MKAIDDLVRAVARPFRHDPGMQREIARELRGHLEDAFDAARADGMDEVQAEEKAVRAFGDPQVIRRRLWLANRRRMRLRVLARSMVEVLLVPAGFLLAAWFLTAYVTGWFFPERRLDAVSATTALLVFGGIYLFTRRYLPRTARFGLAYLRWIPLALKTSCRAVFRSTWLWVPAFLLGTGMAADNLFWELPQFNIAKAHASERHQAVVNWAVLWANIPRELSEVGPVTPGGVYSGIVLCAVYLLFAGRIGRALRTGSGMDPVHARRWHLAFIFGAVASIIQTACAASMIWAFWHGNTALGQDPFFGAFLLLSGLACIPFRVLISALFFTVIVLILRGQALTPDKVLKSASGIFRPMLGFFLVGTAGLVFLYAPIWAGARSLNILAFQGYKFISLGTAFISVIIVCEQCSLLGAFSRLGAFLRHYLWRYVAFIILGATILAPVSRDWISWTNVAQFTTWPVYLGACLARMVVGSAVYLGLTVMCFYFYLTRGGTKKAVGGEVGAPESSTGAGGAGC